MALLLMAAGGSQLAKAQSKQTKKTGQSDNASNQALVERGKYIVENVAMCEQCHTARNDKGVPDRAHWLMGGAVTMRPAYSWPDWAFVEPRLAGAPPGTDEQFIRLLTTGISRTGAPPKLPMPPFRMTRQDAESVLAYLKTLGK